MESELLTLLAECVELCDSEFMRATNLYGSSRPGNSKSLKWPELDSLFFKFQGPSAASLKETAQIARKISEKHGGSGFTLAKDDKQAETLWSDRKNALYSSLMLVQGEGEEGGKGWSTDVW
jgi:D-lactate dehydrogenase (cytochrome)